MRTGSSPMGILVMAELDKLRSAEASLARTLSGLPEQQDPVSEWVILSSIADVRDRANRLERTLDAMAAWSYQEIAPAGVRSRVERTIQSTTA